MAYTKADLDLVDRHIAQGERHIIGQEQIISRLQSKGLPTEKAEALLRQFRETLQEHHDHRDLIAKAVYGESG